MGRALIDPQKYDLDPDTDPSSKKYLRSDHDPQKDPFNDNKRTIIFSVAHVWRYFMAWTTCNIRRSAEV